MEMFKLLMRAEAAEIKVKALEDQVSFIQKSKWLLFDSWLKVQRYSEDRLKNWNIIETNNSFLAFVALPTN